VPRLGGLLLLLAAAPFWLAGGGSGPLPLASLEGEPVQIAPPAAGETVLLHFWASWCPECAVELPVLERVARACEGAPVRIVMVNVAESPATIASFREAHGLGLPVLRDPEGRVWRRFARGLPANLTWTREGRRAETGPRDEAGWRRALGCGDPGAR
jgi:thiol-disulfide isomerase/thioredoxin